MPTGEVYFNSTGNPAMATGGSGDVLTGILTALLAQQYPPQDAALLGVFLHGLAGDFASKNRHAILASDIIEEIPFAFTWLGSVEK
jgi:NAD(P)H-hydrate epimerase